MTKPGGLPYTPSVRAGDWVIVSGQLGVVNGTLVGGFAEQLRQVLVNLETRLAEQGATMADVVKTTVFLRHMNDFATLNELYGEAFAEPRPARSAVASPELPLGGLVEIEAWAYTGQR
ncbi:MAG: RidA family protein [Acidimicrobiales bacterium]